MRDTRKLFLLALWAAVVSGACFWSAPTAAGTDLGPKEQADLFFRQVKAGNINDAYQSLFARSGIAQAKPQALEALRRQTEAYLPLFGKILDWELVEEEKFGSSLVRMVFLLKTEKHPLTWEFFFYKPADVWFASQVTFDDQFRALGPKVSIGARPSS